jgi:hypothetical protein
LGLVRSAVDGAREAEEATIQRAAPSPQFPSDEIVMAPRKRAHDRGSFRLPGRFWGRNRLFGVRK